MTQPAGAAQRAGARSPDDWVERVRAASDIVEIIGQTVALKRSGRNFMGLCPFHDEKTPSFSVNAERQFYHCFSCKVGGDVFKYIQETEHVGFIEATELLSRRAGIPVPERRGAPRGQRTGVLEALEAATVAYEQWLADPATGAKLRAYLERRGLTRETVRTYRMGLAPDGWENLVRRLKGRVTDELMVQAGLASRRDTARGGMYDRFRNRLMVPLVAPGGAVLGFGARALSDEDQPKYLNSPETPVYHKGAFLFGLEHARKAGPQIDELNVVEGYFDVMALHQAGLPNTVATSGTALTPDQVRMIKRLASRVAIAYDGDAAGRDAMLRSLGVLLAGGLDVVVVALAQGEDPDMLVRRDGAEGWARARREAVDPVAFVQKHVFDSGGPGDARERAVQNVVQLAVGIGDPVRARLLLERASQVFGLSENVLQRAVALRRSGQRVDKPLQAAVREQRRGERDLEQRLLQALLIDPRTAADVKRQLSPGDFRNPACAALASWVWQGADGVPADPEAATLERELTAQVPERPDWAGEIRVATRFMLERRLRGQLRERTEQLKHADSDELEKLQKEIVNISASLKALHG